MVNSLEDSRYDDEQNVGFIHDSIVESGKVYCTVIKFYKFITLSLPTPHCANPSLMLPGHSLEDSAEDSGRNVVLIEDNTGQSNQL